MGLRAGMLAGPPSTRAVGLLPGYQRAMAAVVLLLSLDVRCPSGDRVAVLSLPDEPSRVRIAGK